MEIVELNYKESEVEGYVEGRFSSDRYECKLKLSDLAAWGKEMTRRAVKGQDYMTWILNRLQPKMKFQRYKNKEIYRPNDFEVEERMMAIVEDIKKRVKFDEDVGKAGKQTTVEEHGK